MMQVLVLIDTGILGGPGKGVLQLIKASDSSQVNFHVANFGYNKPKSEEFYEVYEAEGVAVHKLSPSAWRLNLSAFKELKNLITSHDVSILQSHGYKAHVYFFLLRFTTGRKWVAVNHGFTTESLRVRFYHLIDRLLVPFADCAVCVSPVLYALFAKLRSKKRPTVYIPNAVDKDALVRHAHTDVRADCGCEAESILLGVFGRFSPEKGQAVALEAFSALSRQYSHLRLVFVGSGQTQESVAERVRELNLGDKVSFAGYRTNMGDYFDAIDLLVLPSYSEGLPNVVLEALASSVPVVATKVGAVPDLIAHGSSGYLVEPGSHVSLADGLEKAIRSLPELKSGAARQLPEEYDPEFRAASFLRVYQELYQ